MQEEHEGEEVDFDESYFFPEWKDTQQKQEAQEQSAVALGRAAAAAWSFSNWIWLNESYY